MKKTIASLILGCVFASSFAEEVDMTFSYSNKNLDTSICGMNVVDTYDVCILLKNEGLTEQGAKIVGLEVPVVSESTVGNYKGWLSKKIGTFTAPGYDFVADIATVAAEPKDGMLKVTFAEPVALPKDGLYVGYTFTVSNIDKQGEKYPVAITNEYKANSLYIRCKNNAYEWQDIAEDKHFCSAMRVNLRGEFSLDALSVGKINDVFAEAGNSPKASISVTNGGVTAITDMDYSYTLEGRTITGNYKFKPTISDIMGSTATITLPLEMANTLGDHTVDFTIEKVNGKPNSSTEASAQFHYVNVETMPVRRTVVEEYTGTWCQFCPRGVAGLEYLRENDPNVITIAYHYQDPMQIKESIEMGKVYSFPCCWLDKTVAGDPLTGTGNSTAYGRILVDYNQRMAVEAPASIMVDTKWDDAKETLTIDSEVEFIYTPQDNSSYRIAYVLVEDGITAPDPDDKNWWQSNNYSQMTGYDNALTLTKFTKMSNPIKDFTFNEVAIYATPFNGVVGSLPTVKGGVKMTHTHTVKMSDCVNYLGDKLVQNPDNIRVVAMVVKSWNDGNEVLNATMADAGKKSPVISEVESLKAQGSVVSEEYYDMTGMRVYNPHHGMLIKVERFDNGSVKTRKIYLAN